MASPKVARVTVRKDGEIRLPESFLSDIDNPEIVAGNGDGTDGNDE